MYKKAAILRPAFIFCANISNIDSFSRLNPFADKYFFTSDKNPEIFYLNFSKNVKVFQSLSERMVREAKVVFRLCLRDVTETGRKDFLFFKGFVHRMQSKTNLMPCRVPNSAGRVNQTNTWRYLL